MSCQSTSSWLASLEQSPALSLTKAIEPASTTSQCNLCSEFAAKDTKAGHRACSILVVKPKPQRVNSSNLNIAPTSYPKTIQEQLAGRMPLPKVSRSLVQVVSHKGHKPGHPLAAGGWCQDANKPVHRISTNPMGSSIGIPLAVMSSACCFFTPSIVFDNSRLSEFKPAIGEHGTFIPHRSFRC